MSETLNPKSESLVAMSSENQWDTLRDAPFAGESTKNARETEVPSEKAVGLQTLESVQTEESYRPVGEMEKSEIAREYMDLLHDLSANFTSPEAINSAVVNSDGSVRDRRGYGGDQEFVKKLYQKNGLELDEGSNFEELRGPGQNALGEDLHYENEDLDRAHTLRMVDGILSGEQLWRESGEALAPAQEKLTNAVNALQELRNEYESKSFLGRLKSKRDFRRQVEEINKTIAETQNDLKRTERQTSDGNARIARSLMEAYSPDYHYGHHHLNFEHERTPDYLARKNEEYNNKFFGNDDDPERQAKIDRALELRKVLGVDR